MTLAITTERLSLQPFPRNSELFNRAMHELLSNADVMRFMSMKRSADAWDTGVYLGKCYELEQYGRGKAFALWEREGVGRFVGVATLGFDQPHSVLFGGYLHVEAQRKGYGVEATRAITEWALALERIYRVHAQCDVRNDGAIKVLERAGFKAEGVLARAWPGFGGEEPRDVLSYSVTR